MNIEQNVKLAKFTSFGVGGPAEYFSQISNSNELLEALKCTTPKTKLWIIGYGSNSLISDDGLEGMVLCVRGGEINVDNDMIIADAGAWWDNVVVKAIENNLWGIELLSEVPGSVGASAYINITAYGQSLGPLVEWIEVWDRITSLVKVISREHLSWDYKSSIFQTEKGKNLIILRVCLKLSRSMKDKLKYQKALDVASELRLDSTSLISRRDIIIETRKRAGSLWQPNSKDHKTVGSFFRNPTVTKEQAELVMSFDESGKTAEHIKLMNKVHGGSEQRVSAAHVMLAAGFHRGQTWNNVKLNDQNLLKIEALDGSKAQDIYIVVRNIQLTVKKKLNITLEPEARILGKFTE